jgi:hypothetical protein
VLQPRQQGKPGGTKVKEHAMSGKPNAISRDYPRWVHSLPIDDVDGRPALPPHCRSLSNYAKSTLRAVCGRAMQLRSYLFQDFTLDSKQRNVAGQIIEVLEVSPECAPSSCNDGCRFRTAKIGEPGA